MSESLETIRTLIDGLSEQERKVLKSHLHKLAPHPLESQWDVDAEKILDAISRSSDLTKRGVRGIIAEAVFVDDVATSVADRGWQVIPVEGDKPYDALLKRGEVNVRIQVKLQRLEKGKPKLFHVRHYPKDSLYVVEVQKTRGGKKKKKKLAGTDATITDEEPGQEQTRPYRFGDFDIIAVNMHPSSGNWKDFRYTLSSRLLPRKSNNDLIETLQPVAATPNEAWTDSLSSCLEWYEMKKKGRILTELLHVKKQRTGSTKSRGAAPIAEV